MDDVLAAPTAIGAVGSSAWLEIFGGHMDGASLDVGTTDNTRPLTHAEASLLWASVVAYTTAHFSDAREIVPMFREAYLMLFPELPA